MHCAQPASPATSAASPAKARSDRIPGRRARSARWFGTVHPAERAQWHGMLTHIAQDRGVEARLGRLQVQRKVWPLALIAFDRAHRAQHRGSVLGAQPRHRLRQGAAEGGCGMSGRRSAWKNLPDGTTVRRKPVQGQWCPRPLELLENPAYRILARSAHGAVPNRSSRCGTTAGVTTGSSR